MVAKDLKAGSLFILKKFQLANKLTKSYANYIELHEMLNLIPHQLLLDDISREDALDVAKNAISGHTLLSNSYRNFAKTLPSNTEVAGYKILLGENYKDTFLINCPGTL